MKTNRVIFRAWNLAEKRMYYNVQDAYDMAICHNKPDKNHPSNENCVHDFLPQSFGEVLSDSNYKVMQFTGIMDKNGKNIFHGDIIQREFKLVGGEIDKQISYVEWGSYGDSEYVNNIECWIADNWPVSDLGGLHGMIEHTIEVIGNIYENPELLKNEN